ncbi:tRNA lysidine(34) synthetase TilS [Variovorax sp. J31P207]|uniref:tRNA lysidine(34) synthetase TilS n=1 Tax=Variovorax sp. J31P207 TaxID=3053510 RepID=UPI0025755321|nr:tRNA lysidine(34) synthetase TilS [Variovorax sp. J31P207]MDM0068000.1 tRNA lysidine(34) synthetase TilS [Variovorax sp. J31P207]
MENPAAQALASWAAAPLPLAIAYSGGADSTALLHAAAARWPGQVHALHVHHGLQQAADDFEAHCAAACAALGVPLHSARVDARHAPGESPEDAARRARYATLAALALSRGLRHVALAQHADDQVETMLIALGRGAGLDGLAGMPRCMERHGVSFHRPLLDLPADALRAWLAASGVAHVVDPTNADLRYTRNRLRQLVLPALEAALPQFRETFARSARNAARGSALLAELAARDLAEAGAPPALAVLRALPRERLANALRHWLRRDHGVVPSEAQLEQLQDQIAACSTRGHQIRLKIASGRVEREGAVLHWYNASPLSQSAAPARKR